MSYPTLPQIPGMPPGLGEPPLPPPEPESIFNILSLKEIPFYYLGLTSPLSRFLFGIVTTSGLIFMIKPSFAFKYGDVRTWNLFGKSRESGTWVPWWVPGTIIGGVLALYI